MLWTVEGRTSASRMSRPTGPKLRDDSSRLRTAYLASVPFLILCVAKESEHKDKKEEPAQRHPVERILKLGSQACLAVSSFIGVGVVAQLLIKEGITSQATLFPFLFQRKRGKSLRDDPSTSSKEKGKVLRVLPSGRWVPRNQG